MLNYVGPATLALSLIMTGCSSAMTSKAPIASIAKPGEKREPVEWPLKFQVHYFDAYSFSTRGCKVYYGNMWRRLDSEDELRISSDQLGEGYPGVLAARMGPIPNFPKPAKVSWVSQDGTSLEAEVDIGEIFSDELVRHNLHREDVSPGGPGPGVMPGIILEVNDRTINVYMRAHISTAELQEPGNRHSNFRNDLIKVYSRTY